MTTIQKKFRKYTDFSLAFTRNPFSNQLNVKTNAEAIKQSVRNILLTRKGEKPFDPEFGSPIANLLFENASPVVATVMQDEIERALATYEPRIKVSYVVVKFLDNHTVSADINATIINVNDPITINVIFNRLR